MAKAKEVNHAVNMYRISGDDWDSWGAVDSHFQLAAWAAQQNLTGAPGLHGRSWPDLDMLPFGVITSPGSGRGPYKNTSLSPDAQRTQMTLWAIARSPLMFGGDATQLDAFTTSLLTNKEVLALNHASSANRQVAQSSGSVTWAATLGATTYAALFNRDSKAATLSVTLSQLGIRGGAECAAADVWSGGKGPSALNGAFKTEVASEGVALLAITCAR